MNKWSVAIENNNCEMISIFNLVTLRRAVLSKVLHALLFIFHRSKTSLSGMGEIFHHYVMCVCVCWRGYNSNSSGLETVPHIDTWTNETAHNGKNDTAIGGKNSVNYVKTLWPLVTIFKCKCRVSHLLSTAYKLTSLCPFFVYGPCASTASLTPVIFQIK